MFSPPPQPSIPATTRCRCMRPQGPAAAPTPTVGQNICASKYCATMQKPTPSGRSFCCATLTPSARTRAVLSVKIPRVFPTTSCRTSPRPPLASLSTCACSAMTTTPPTVPVCVIISMLSILPAVMSPQSRTWQSTRAKACLISAQARVTACWTWCTLLKGQTS